jgi:tyrosinase
MRRNVLSLKPADWAAWVAEVRRVKSTGAYDDLVRRHVGAMMHATLLPGETGTQRNIAHRGPAVIPWHRQFLADFERLTGVPTPYWAWNHEGSNWRNSRVWSLLSAFNPGWNQLVYIAATGSYSTRQGILRQFGSGSMPSAPSYVSSYDARPWREDSPLGSSQRRRIEVAHNTVHNQVGGIFKSPSSPSDPLFWLHHSNVDRLFEGWRRRYGTASYPRSGPPFPHNYGDVMPFLLTRSRPYDVLERLPAPSYDTLTS